MQGFVMSDWGATHSTVQSANSGLDMQMPDATFFGDALAKAIANGQVPQSRLDDMVLRILTAMYMVGIMDTPQVRVFSIFRLRCFNASC
jgi:beta-glucosidase